MISASSRRAEFLRLAGVAAARCVLEAVDRRPRAAKDRRAVAMSMSMLLRRVFLAPRIDAVRTVSITTYFHTASDELAPRTSRGCWPWRMPGSSTGAMATSTANCGRLRGDCSRQRPDRVFQRKRRRVRASSAIADGIRAAARSSASSVLPPAPADRVAGGPSSRPGALARSAD